MVRRVRNGEGCVPAFSARAAPKEKKREMLELLSPGKDDANQPKS